MTHHPLPSIRFARRFSRLSRRRGVPTDPESIVDFDLPEVSYEQERREAIAFLEALAAAEAEQNGG